jgi:hypothetical protein
VVAEHRRADEQLGSALVVRGSLTRRANDLQLKLRGLSRLEWCFLAVSRRLHGPRGQERLTLSYLGTAVAAVPRLSAPSQTSVD